MARGGRRPRVSSIDSADTPSKEDAGYPATSTSRTLLGTNFRIIEIGFPSRFRFLLRVKAGRNTLRPASSSSAPTKPLATKVQIGQFCAKAIWGFPNPSTTLSDDAAPIFRVISPPTDAWESRFWERQKSTLQCAMFGCGGFIEMSNHEISCTSGTHFFSYKQAPFFSWASACLFQSWFSALNMLIMLKSVLIFLTELSL